MLRILLLAVVLAVTVGASPIGATDAAPRGWDKPTPAAQERPGYGVVESIMPLRRQARTESLGEPSASTGSSSPAAASKRASSKSASATYLVKVRMDDGSIQVRSQKLRGVGVGSRVQITNAGEVLPE